MKKIPWDRLSINAPDESKSALFRTAYITDGTTSMLIERCFFPEFDEMCENIQELTKAARGRN
ncbi:hypothetical protein IJT17_07335 [bacterium]|nr:hypothetical protein [bacterium]